MDLDEYGFRALVEPKSFNEERRSVDIIMSTEYPVRRYEWMNDRLVDEILPIVGAEMRGDQIPLLNSHSMWQIGSILGSVRNIKKEDDKIRGTAFFADTENAKEAMKLLKGGHLRDISIGYRVKESKYIAPGDNFSYKGKTYQAKEDIGIRLATKYEVFESSVTPVGANPETKVRAKTQLTEEEKPLDKDKEKETEKREEPKTPETPKIDEGEIRRKAIEEERKRTAEISELCRKFDVDSTPFLSSGRSISEVKDEILNQIAERRTQNLPVNPEVTEDSFDRTRKYIENCLCFRLGNEIPNKDQEKARHSLTDLAREYLKEQGVNTRNLSKIEISQMVFRSGFSHATGDFPNLLANTLNKTLQKAYEEAPRTWEMWCASEEVSDFKQQTRNRLSESPDLEIINEGGEYTEYTMSEEKEVYSLDKYGKIFSITWEALVNDDLNGFARIARQHGFAASRTVNRAVYAVLTANAAMGDGTALFHASHNNLLAGAALSFDSLSAARAAMRRQTGLRSDVILNLSAQYLIVPATLETLAEELMGPLKIGDNQGHSPNPFAGRYMVVAEPLLDENSVTAWYMAANYNQVDTIVVSFLEGNRSPYLAEEEGFKIDGRNYKVRLPFTVKAIDWRGLQYNTGVAE